MPLSRLFTLDKDQFAVQIAPADRLLTAAEFQTLADVPPEVEWFANLSNPNTRRTYEAAVKDFMRFAGVRRPEEFRTVTRAHLLAWCDELRRRDLGGATIRRRLASLASQFEYLCEKNAVTHNPVKGVERPRTESGEGNAHELRYARPPSPMRSITKPTSPRSKNGSAAQYLHHHLRSPAHASRR